MLLLPCSALVHSRDAIAGDVIGCGVDFSQHRAFYTKNGTFLGKSHASSIFFSLTSFSGMVFENVGKGHELYPAVGLRHTSESIRVNFGHAPFKFAIENHVHSQQDRVWADIQQTKINWDLLQGITKHEDMTDGRDSLRNSTAEEDEMKAPLRKLVLSYLAHHGYAKTAHAFQAQCERNTFDRAAEASTSAKVEQDMDTDETTEDQELRTRVDIVNAVLRGDIDTALDQTRDYFPTVLEREQGLMLFKLRCRKFVELIVEASEALKKVKQPQSKPQTPEPLARGRELQSVQSRSAIGEDVKMDGMDGEGAMDVDDPSHEAHPQYTSASSSSTSVSPPSAPQTPRARHASRSPSSPRPASPHAAAAKVALHTAIAYGQKLEADYKHDVRPEIRAHLKRTFGVVAYTDPLAAGGEIAEMAGQEARVRLGNELNQAILGTFTRILLCCS